MNEKMNGMFTEKEVLEKLMQNSTFRKAFRELMIDDPNLAEELGVNGKVNKTIHVWCVELTNANDGRKYYHPIVIPNFTYPTLDAMMEVENYTMMYSEDQFGCFEYDPMIDMFRCMHPGKQVRMLTVPEEVFEQLKAALSSLVKSVLDELNATFIHLDKIATITHQDVTAQKMQLTMSLFNQLTTIDSCLNQALDVVDSTSHIYEETNEYDDCDDDYDYEDEYDEEDEEDDGCVNWMGRRMSADDFWPDEDDEEVAESAPELYRLYFRIAPCEDVVSDKIAYALLTIEQVEILKQKSRNACRIITTDGESIHSMYIHHIEREDEERPF